MNIEHTLSTGTPTAASHSFANRRARKGEGTQKRRLVKELHQLELELVHAVIQTMRPSSSKEAHENRERIETAIKESIEILDKICLPEPK